LTFSTLRTVCEHHSNRLQEVANFCQTAFLDLSREGLMETAIKTVKVILALVALLSVSLLMAGPDCTSGGGGYLSDDWCER
jgi:hypothetical protein